MCAWKQTIKLLVIAVLIFALLPTHAFAAQSSSSNYRVNEVFFGSGGELNACSGSFCAKQSAGELTVGQTSSDNFSARAGFNTNREPYIEFIVDPVNIDLGTISPTSTKTANANFTVKTYLADGYVVTNASDPPRNNTYVMPELPIPTGSQVGTEQFGINLTANTDPVTFGANPTQSPDSTFGFGQVTLDYSNPNTYKYVKNDIIAQSLKSSSYTDYTISYIFNISNITPGGTYTLRHDLVATATF